MVISCRSPSFRPHYAKMLLLIYIILSISYSIAPPVKNGIIASDNLYDSFCKGVWTLCRKTILFPIALFLHPLSAPLRRRPCCRTHRLLRCGRHPESRPCGPALLGRALHQRYPGQRHRVFLRLHPQSAVSAESIPSAPKASARRSPIEHLAEIFLDLQYQGAHNITLVTPGQWRPWIIAALDIARAEGLRLPIVCNTGGYETVESVEAWRGYIDIWLADLKYVSSALSAELSSAPDYFAQAKPAIEADDGAGRTSGVR